MTLEDVGALSPSDPHVASDVFAYALHAYWGASGGKADVLVASPDVGPDATLGFAFEVHAPTASAAAAIEAQLSALLESPALFDPYIRAAAASTESEATFVEATTASYEAREVVVSEPIDVDDDDDDDDGDGAFYLSEVTLFGVPIYFVAGLGAWLLYTASLCCVGVSCFSCFGAKTQVKERSTLSAFGQQNPISGDLSPRDLPREL